jgi:hypothetical protein
MGLAKKIFIYTNCWISLGAVLAAYATACTFSILLPNNFYYFLFAATLCSYNLHWYFTPPQHHVRERENWSVQNKNVILALTLIAGIGAAFFFVQLPTAYYVFIIPLVVFTFIYTAPKIPYAPFNRLRNHVYAKTLYLTIGWLYATVILPIIITQPFFSSTHYQYAVHRFAFLFIVCGLFDYRDRVEDINGGVKSMLAAASIGLIHIIVQVLLGISILAGLKLYTDVSTLYFISNFVPILLLMLFYKKSIASKNEIWFYGLLDGLIFVNGIIYALVIMVQKFL